MTDAELSGHLAFLGSALRGSPGVPAAGVARFARANSVAEILAWLAGPALPDEARTECAAAR
ncbi:MAG TPA: hypothetical protein VFY93_04260, partial [Planctomycetota bacterium]|nr:hypothetical protein [Planctomycetota bacterium]